MIIVGIENTNRLRDLTPGISNNNMDKANPFVQFLANELIPYIDQNYKTAPYRLLIGHSLRGLTAINILSNFPNLFNTYIGIDPSMWFDNEKFLNNAISNLPKQSLEGKRLFIGTANTLPKGMTLETLQYDKSTETQHIRSILKLDKFLKQNSIKGFKYAQKYYENDHNNSVPMISEYDGMRFIFDHFKMDATEKYFTDTTYLIALKLITHYDIVSKEMGYNVSPPEAFINYFAYEALSKQHYSKAKALLQINIHWYPESCNTYDDYGDYFVAVKQCPS